jgi:glutaminyl-tRNA synthetase
MHWVSAEYSLPAEVRIYNPLFTNPDPSGSEGFEKDLNPDSLEVLSGAWLEPALRDAKVETPVQFERQGYFTLDKDATTEKLVFTRTTGLRDTFAKDVAKDAATAKPAR